MLNEKQVLDVVPLSRTSIYRLEKAGKFPRSTYISANRRVWFEDEIIAWQNAVNEFDPSRGRGKGRRCHGSGWHRPLRCGRSAASVHPPLHQAQLQHLGFDLDVPHCVAIARFSHRKYRGQATRLWSSGKPSPSRWSTPSASSLPMHARLQSRCCASADALTVAGFLDRGRSMVTVSAIVFVPVASRQDTPIAVFAWMERVMAQSFT
jgi:prophage regulatory protein